MFFMVTLCFLWEKDDGCTFDMAAWVEDHRSKGWCLEKEMQIPCWLGIHDVFMCFVKHYSKQKRSLTMKLLS